MALNLQYPSLSQLRSQYIRSETIYHKAQNLVRNDLCTLTSRGDRVFSFVVEDRFEDFKVNVKTGNAKIGYQCSCASPLRCCPHSAAALISLNRIYEEEETQAGKEGAPYTREEMIERVLKERKEKAEKEQYHLTVGDNIYGFHKLRTESGRTYELTIRDFKRNEGYCSCPDFKTNKLGTCKHLIFSTHKIKKKYPVAKLAKSGHYPFVEIYCDPLHNYDITCYYDRQLSDELKVLLDEVFVNKNYILPQDYADFLMFINKAQNFKEILIRPEVIEKIDKHFEKELYKGLAQEMAPDFSKIKADLFDYQKAGVTFSLFKAASIIGDEMGLGKTVQAIAVAVLKKQIFNLNYVLVICPASLKYQWEKEIKRFSDEKAIIVQGNRDERHQLYKKNKAFFVIANYEAVMRDVTVIRQNPPDMIILDEAQRIKNYDTKTSHAVKSIPKKHALVITGTPLENRLLDLYSIMNFVDPEILSPQWEFSMNHCYFDKSKKNRITGYYNLQKLKEQLKDVIIRREKKDVFQELPSVQQVTVPVELHPYQADIHAGFSRSLVPILAKKHKTFYDMQRIQQLLTSMRMVCDSTFLIDKETNYSPKLDELKEILLEKLDIISNKKKVIIFSEWKTMLNMISKLLKSHKIGHVMLSGEVPVKNRGFLIDEFANNPECLVFLSTEAGGTGLNLQCADTVINFDLPWNPAKKNQRIGRINRIGQESSKITAINMVALNSIESKIADGIVLKQNLFDAILNDKNLTDEVDFSAKGRSTFIDQVQKLVRIDEPEQISETELKVKEEPSESFADVVEEKFEIAATQADEEKTFTPESQQPAVAPQPRAEEIEAVLNQGMGFLSGVFKMATGKDLVAEGGSISVNKETGEVTMKFKLSGF